jgi:hypothetical protein
MFHVRSLDHVGLFGRTIEDLALLLEEIAGTTSVILTRIRGGGSLPRGGDGGATHRAALRFFRPGGGIGSPRTPRLPLERWSSIWGGAWRSSS